MLGLLPQLQRTRAVLALDVRVVTEPARRLTIWSRAGEDGGLSSLYPNGPQVWAALLAEFAAELRHLEPGAPGGDAPPAAELDDTGALWVPRLGGRAALSPDLENVARTGRWNRTRYPGRSEARMAVLGSAAARGWQLADVQAAIASGAWDGLAALYERRSEPGRMERLLPLEWRKTMRRACFFIS